MSTICFRTRYTLRRADVQGWGVRTMAHRVPDPKTMYALNKSIYASSRSCRLPLFQDCWAAVARLPLIETGNDESMTRAVDVAAFYDPYVTCLKRPHVFLCGRILRGLTSLHFMNDFLVCGGSNKTIQFICPPGNFHWSYIHHLQCAFKVLL